MIKKSNKIKNKKIKNQHKLKIHNVNKQRKDNKIKLSTCLNKINKLKN
jgi:hypothetical protein